MIHIDAGRLATTPLDMRAGTEAVLVRVVQVRGGARPHHAYLFANRRATRMKVLVHDGLGVWLATRRLHQGRFVWPRDVTLEQMSLTQPQLQALVLGLPWQRLDDDGATRPMHTPRARATLRHGSRRGSAHAGSHRGTADLEQPQGLQPRVA